MTDQEKTVKGALQESPYRDVRSVVVTVIGGRIYLSGEVRSYYYKQLAQEVVRNAPIDGCSVVNEVSVSYKDEEKL